METIYRMPQTKPAAQPIAKPSTGSDCHTASHFQGNFKTQSTKQLLV